MIQTLVQVTHASYTSPDHQQAMRIIADHLKGSIFLIDGGVTPGNKTQGYFLRRLLRRVVLKLRSLTNQPLTPTAYRQLVDSVIQTYQPVYFANLKNTQTLTDTIVTESQKFEKTMAQGLRIIHKTPADQITGQFAFDLYQSFGFPLELTEEILAEPGFKVDKAAFKAEFTKHQERSRTASQGLFKSGLADHSDAIVKYHTTTHLLHQALRQVLGSHVQQMGSNITAERLRFDFKHPQKLTDEEKKKIETLINQKIQAYLPVHKTIEAQDQALKSGALAFFREKYPDQVSVYTIGHDVNKDWYSKEICGGPHVTSTGQIGAVKIEKETAVGAGVRRIYVVLAG